MTETTSTNGNMVALSAAGISVWLDDLSREFLESGELRRHINELAVVGVTTNPAIFEKAIGTSPAYEQGLRDAVAKSRDVDSVVTELTTTDVRDACDTFADIYNRTEGVDGRVSIEVDPRLATDTEKTIEQAVELSALVDRPNVLIKIPATPEGLPAITEVIGRGIDVNVTLIFSPAQYRRVAEAYIAGLEAADAAGHDLRQIHSVASVFVSRLDGEIDGRLAEGSELRGTAGLAGARLCHAAFEEIFESDRFRALAEKGGRKQRILWASTGVKDPVYPDTMYVTGLVTHGCVNTMPHATLQAFADHGEVQGDTVRGTATESANTLEAIAEAGVDLDDVFAKLEREGVEKFVTAWDGLLSAVGSRIDEVPS